MSNIYYLTSTKETFFVHFHHSNDPTRLLLTFNAKINARDEVMGNTALHLAAGVGNNIAAKLLIEAGADLEAKNKKVCESVERK